MSVCWSVLTLMPFFNVLFNNIFQADSFIYFFLLYVSYKTIKLFLLIFTFVHVLCFLFLFMLLLSYY